MVQEDMAHCRDPEDSCSCKCNLFVAQRWRQGYGHAGVVILFGNILGACEKRSRQLGVATSRPTLEVRRKICNSEPLTMLAVLVADDLFSSAA